MMSSGFVLGRRTPATTRCIFETTWKHRGPTVRGTVVRARAAARTSSLAQNSNLCLDVNGGQPDCRRAAHSVHLPHQSEQQWSLSNASLPSSWSGMIFPGGQPTSRSPIFRAETCCCGPRTTSSLSRATSARRRAERTPDFDSRFGNVEPGHRLQHRARHVCPGTANLSTAEFCQWRQQQSQDEHFTARRRAAVSTDAAMSIPRATRAMRCCRTGSSSRSAGRGAESRQQDTARSGRAGKWRPGLTSVTASPVTGPDPQGSTGARQPSLALAVGNAQIFHAGPSAQMHWITTAGTGASPRRQSGDDPYASTATRALRRRHDPETGGAAGVPECQRDFVRVRHQHNGGLWSPMVAPMAYRRAFGNGVVLPNGGGDRRRQTFPVPFFRRYVDPSFRRSGPRRACLSSLNVMQTPRNYHSTAILLPDGVSSWRRRQCGRMRRHHLNAEILSPPYLSNPDGSTASRRGSRRLLRPHRWGTMAVTTDSPVMSFVLMRLSSVTHTVNNDQRRVPLAIQSTSGSTSYTALGSVEPGIAYPDTTCLFALNAQGAPSVAATVAFSSVVAAKMPIRFLLALGMMTSFDCSGATVASEREKRCVRRAEAAAGRIRGSSKRLAGGRRAMQRLPSGRSSGRSAGDFRTAARARVASRTTGTKGEVRLVLRCFLLLQVLRTGIDLPTC